uniref:Ig-like domain-containing protein n=1 Tax=Oreochromis niloticus TaxID=8128 RepID=I3KVN2_ORENI
MKDDPQHLQWYADQSLHTNEVFKHYIWSLRQRFNQTGGMDLSDLLLLKILLIYPDLLLSLCLFTGVHILQSMNGCEWDDETGEVTGFIQYGYDGEDFIALDLQKLTWITAKPQAVITKLRWDTEKTRLEHNKELFIHKCPELLKNYLKFMLQFKDNVATSYLFSVLPSVSLLQKSCHATGFYPDRGMMFWRKDGEKIHEGVDPGEILPNNDGTFQLSVDLKLSSVTPEDWQRYDCVFHIISFVIFCSTEKPTDMGTFIGAAVIVLAFTIVTAVTFLTYINKKCEKSKV